MFFSSTVIGRHSWRIEKDEKMKGTLIPWILTMILTILPIWMMYYLLLKFVFHLLVMSEVKGMFLISIGICILVVRGVMFFAGLFKLWEIKRIEEEA